MITHPRATLLRRWLRGLLIPAEARRRLRPSRVFRLEELEERVTPDISFSETAGGSNWFNGDIHLTNNTSTPINNWTLSFNLVGTISAYWNCVITSPGTNQFTAVAAGGSSTTIAPGASVDVDFTLLGDPTQTPTNYAINGVPVSTPTISIGNATITQGSPTTNTVPDFFHTNGNQIVDAYGNDVKIASIAFYGLQFGTYAIDGLGTPSSGPVANFSGWNLQAELNMIANTGFNTIRLPFSNQLIDTPNATPSGINYTLNPDLVGLNGLQVMDKVIADAGKAGLRVILDDHHTTVDGPNSTGLWYAGAPDNNWATDSTFVTDWEFLAQRYAGNSTVIGADLFNEPEGQATWGDGNVATDWRLAAEVTGDAIQKYSPNWLIIVEGIQYTTQNGGADWWGGNLSLAGQYPVQLNSANHVVYSAHDYSQDVGAVFPGQFGQGQSEAGTGGQSWFNDPNFPNNLPAVWDHYWGYLYTQNIAPVWVGEFGTSWSDSNNPNLWAATEDQEWLAALTSYMEDPDGMQLASGQQGISWSYWAWQPNSGDVGGLLNTDWTTVNTTKLAYLTPMQFTFPAAPAGTNPTGTSLTFPVTLSAASSTPVTVAYTTVDGTAIAGVDYTATSGTLTFAPGETSLTIIVPVLTNAASISTKTLSVVLSSPSDATIAQGTGTFAPTATTGGGTVTTPPATGGAAGVPPNQQYLDAAYMDLLGRAADPAGLAYWLGALDAGTLTRQQVAFGLTHSPEYYSTRLIIPAYENYLGRAPSPSEINGWILAVQHGMTDEQLQSMFLSSPEYYAHSGGNDQLWTAALYQDLLGRTPSAAEESVWLQALARGATHAQVAYDIVASPEHEGSTVQDDYSLYLGRTASAAEVQSWVSAFGKGDSNEDIVSDFIGSDEYFSKHTGN